MAKTMNKLPNLIGIAGKKGSGKDTAYDIINYLVFNDCAKLDKEFDIDNFAEWKKLRNPITTTYRNVKYADKLKDMVCLLIGCTRADLESEEFKSKPLGEEWWVYTDGCAMVSYIGGNYKRLDGYATTVTRTTPRILLQLLGTECGRDIIHPNTWINATFASYKPILNKWDNEGNNMLPNWIISDVRFPNELKAIEDRGGVGIRLDCWFEKRLTKQEAMDLVGDENCGRVCQIYSDGSESTVTDMNQFDDDDQAEYVLDREEIEHESETALDNASFYCHIDTTKDISSLARSLQKIIKGLLG